jgi:hypothetical protein
LVPLFLTFWRKCLAKPPKARAARLKKIMAVLDRTCSEAPEDMLLVKPSKEIEGPELV